MAAVFDDMLARTVPFYTEILSKLSPGRKLDLQATDLNAGVAFGGASVALLVLALQFIRPLRWELVFLWSVARDGELAAISSILPVLGAMTAGLATFYLAVRTLKKRRRLAVD